MAWSYSKNPSSTPLDKVRFLIGDTVEDDPLLQNEEIESVLEEYVNEYRAAAECCEVIAANFSRSSDKEIGPLKIKQSGLSDKYLKLAKTLRGKAKSKSEFVGIQSQETHKPIFGIDFMNAK